MSDRDNDTDDGFDELYDWLMLKSGKTGEEAMQYAEDAMLAGWGGEDEYRSYCNALLERLMIMSGKEGPQALQFANDVCHSVLGDALNLDAFTHLDADQARDLYFRVEGILTTVDLVTSVFLVEQMKVVSSKNGWDTVHFVNKICHAVLSDALDTEAYANFDHDHMREVLLRVRKVFDRVGVLERDPIPLDMVTLILKCYRP